MAADVLGHMLRARDPGTRRAGIWAMGRRCETRRSAPALFVPLFVPAIDDPDPDVRGEAIGALRRAGAVTGRFADMLAAVAARYPQVAGEQGFTDEYRAVETPLLLADPRWIEPVCAAAAAGHQPDLSTEARFSPTVLAEIRSRLAADPTRADVLASVVAQWGTDAAAAVPDLIAAIPHTGPQVARALLELGHDEPTAVPYLRAETARTGDPPAALAVWRITGDAQPLLDTLRSTLSWRRQAPPWEMSGLGDVGDGLLTGTAARTHPERQVQLLAARIVAAVDGPAAVLPTVSAVLAGGDTSAHLAATLIAELAQANPAAVATLEPQLRQQLDDRWNRIAAARALARLGVQTAELARPLVDGIADYRGRYAVTAIIELRAVETNPALEELVADDRRFNTISFGARVVSRGHSGAARAVASVGCIAQPLAIQNVTVRLGGAVACCRTTCGFTACPAPGWRSA
ncbi:hypothetical protein [Polymorphospora sp. NPDC050346]|uniref:hypothetical protein n=1 Tax=Polymorphospora sp. NPDC050346 TaxID=3155780 RepID=UPI0033D6918C